MDTPTVELDEMRDSANQACRLLRVLANPDRLIILCQLSKGEMCVGEIEEQLGINQPTLSQQLTVLRSDDLVSTRKEGKNIYYQIKSQAAMAVIGTLYEQFCKK